MTCTEINRDSQVPDKISHFAELKAQIDRLNAGEEMSNVPDEMVEYRAEEFYARSALLSQSRGEVVEGEEAGEAVGEDED